MPAIERTRGGGVHYTPMVSSTSLRPRRLRSLLWTLVLAFAWLASAAVLGKSDDNRPFSSDELAQLRSGQLVKRASSEHRGTLQLMGGSSWQLIDAPPDAVYRALLDTAKYNRMLPAVTASKLVNEQAGARVIRLEHKRGPIGLSYD